MIPAGFSQLLQASSILRVDHSILEPHCGTDQVALPDTIDEKLQVSIIFMVAVGLGFDTHDLPKDDTIGKYITSGIIRPAMGNFGCHCQ